MVRGFALARGVCNAVGFVYCRRGRTVIAVGALASWYRPRQRRQRTLPDLDRVHRGGRMAERPMGGNRCCRGSWNLHRHGTRPTKEMNTLQSRASRAAP